MTKGSVSTQKKLESLSNNRAELLRLLLHKRQPGASSVTAYPRNGRTSMPASWAQQRLWFIDQLEGNAGAAYYIPVGLSLRGTLKQRALQDALDDLVRRHETLRTIFVNVAGELRQEIAPEGSLPLQNVDLSNLPRDERGKQVRLLAQQESQRRFDLRQRPLIRALLMRLQADEHVLLITMHHIISDGWSAGILIRELSALYKTRLGGGDSLEPLPVQYADYAQWQLQVLRGETLEKQLAYWRAHLDGAPPQLELPTDRPRPAMPSYHGENIAVVLDTQLCADLRAYAQQREMTLFMILCAGWALLLSRLSGQDHVVLGTPVANRQRPEVEGLIGFFVNTLALHIPTLSYLPLNDYLAQVKDVTLGAYDHQDVPFEKVVEAVHPQRSLNRNPIFQVMFALQNVPKSEPRFPDLRVASLEGVDEPAIFDLWLSLEEQGDTVSGSVNYATDLFDRDTVEMWIACFVTLLKGMIAQPESSIGSLPILFDHERRRVVELFNATQSPYSHDKLIHELFETQAERTPHATAVEYAGSSLTYAELNRRANQLARYLRNQGAGPDVLVGICVERGLSMIIGLLAVLKAGSAYLPLDPNYPADRLRYMLEDALPQVVLAQEKFDTILPDASAKKVFLTSELPDVSGELDSNIPVTETNLTSRNLVYVIYTSGSTGRPKGTAMAHGSMTNLMQWHQRSFPESEGTRVLQYAALSFDVAFQEIFSTLCTGGTLVLLDEEIRRDSKALLELINARGIARLFLPPLMLQSLAEHARAIRDLPERLRDVITAGEQLRITPEIVNFLGRLESCRLHNHYGPTETHVVTTLTLSGNPHDWPELPSIGRPIANTQIYVLDEQQQPTPTGVSGEIYIGGVGLARGYLRRPDMTNRRFVPNPLDPRSETRLYKAGDLARWQADGTLEYLGRNDDQVKIRGFRIELGEIETRLGAHDQVKEAVVVARQDSPGDTRLAAYITLRGETAPSVQALRAHLKAALPEFMIPSAFVVLHSLPLTPSGKLNRRALPVPPPEAYAGQHFELPCGPVEAALAAIWLDLLRVERVGRFDNFFDLGGHSLLAVKMLYWINERLGTDLKVTDVYKNPSIQELAMRIQSGRSHEAFVELMHEAKFPEDIVVQPIPRHSKEPALFLTGATGFVGRFLLRQLLEDTDSVVYCLVRAQSEVEATSRLQAVMTEWALWSEAFARRVIAVPGDLRRSKLGLNASTYDLVCSKVGEIYHCATSMNHVETYAMARRANVESTLDLMRMATSGELKRVHYISTLGIFSSRKDSLRVINEASSIDQEMHCTSSGYLASKWVGEKIVITASERGIPCDVFRLGHVCADAALGRYDKLQDTYRLLKTCLLSGYGIQGYGFEMAPLPVDYVARAIVALAIRHPTGKGIFHIAGGDHALANLFERCNEIFGGSLRLLPLHDWIREVKRLHQNGQSLPITPLLEFYEQQSDTTESTLRIDCGRTHRELAAAGLPVPLFDNDMLRASLKAMLSNDEDLRRIRSHSIA